MASLELLLAGRWYFLALILLTYVLRIYKQHERLNDFKGPFGASISSIWMIRAIGSKNAHKKYADANEKYGPIARIGPNHLITTNPELIIRMSQARSPYIRSKWYEGMKIQPGHDNIFSQRDEKLHDRRRAQMSAGYNGKENPSIEATIDEHITNFIRLIRSKYISSPKLSNPMDLARKAQYFTLDVITDLAFGRPFGDLVADADIHGYVQNTDEMLATMVTLGSIPVLSDILKVKWIGDLAISDKDPRGIGKCMGVAKELISERFGKNPVVRPDMLNSFIRNGVPQSDLTSETLLQLLAGSDTSATLIRTTILYLVSDPRIYRTLQSEIDNAIKAGKVSRPVRERESLKLPYLQAVIKESLRIIPPAVGLLSKLVPPEGDVVEIEGRSVPLPGGAEIAICGWGMQHTKEIFGDDADEFRPERWLEMDENSPKLARMLRTVDLCFGYGKYLCLGRGMALMEVNKVIVELLRSFEFAVVNPTKPWRCEEFGFFSMSDQWVRVYERADAL